MVIKNIGVLYHPRVEATRIKAGEVEVFLRSRGVSVWAGSSWDKEDIASRLDSTDLLVTVGGDGTILRAVQAVIPNSTPITGVNLGKLGFMTTLNAEDVNEKLPELIAGGGEIDERAMLQAEVNTIGGETQVYHALNDVVLARGEVVRLVRVEASINGQPLTTYKADAVICATATGSTGYALAAGGPVLHPESREFILAPVAPHLSPSYSLVLPETAEVTLSPVTHHPPVASIDGHINITLLPGEKLSVKHSPHTARFLRIRSRDDFYASLEMKLRGNK